MGNPFNKVQFRRPQRSTFDLSYDHKLSLKMGKLVPFHLQECVPGDKFSMSSEGLFRMMPMLAPIMHKVDIFQHFFFVPNRLCWQRWETFITDAEDGNNPVSIPPAFPVLDYSVLGTVTTSSLADYMGIPPGNFNLIAGSGNPVSAMPFAAYQKIYQDYYRDENLETPTDSWKLVDGTQAPIDTAILLTLRTRAWEHDRFTSCLPFAQKGAPVEIPLDFSNAPITYTATGDPWLVKTTAGGTPPGPDDVTFNFGELVNSTGGTKLTLDPNGTLEADLSGATTTTTINDLRLATRVQMWLEKNARAGSRYIENIYANFGVRSSDKRLQRAEYIGGSRATMAISEVLQTSSTDVTTPQANMAGHGIGVAGQNYMSHFCEEHGFIIGILSIRPKTSYFQGIHKHFTKFDRYDYLWPDFAFLGEQAVLKKELFYHHNVASADGYNKETFGYEPRYNEYRYNSARVSGQMETSLDFWHMARKFANTDLPSLNGSFIQCNPDKRIFAVNDPNEDEIVAHIFVNIRASRMLPLYGNPGSL